MIIYILLERRSISKQVIVSVHGNVFAQCMHACVCVLTNINAALLGSMLSAVPVPPVFELVFRELLISKHQHHNTLKTHKANAQTTIAK